MSTSSTATGRRSTPGSASSGRLTMLGGGGNPAAWWDVGGERTGHDVAGTATDLTTIAQGNDHIGISVTTTTTSAADAWWAPIETISNSENGFERVYQGSGAAPVVAARARRPASAGRGRSATSWRRRRDRALEATVVSRLGRPLVVHGHFYQPPRLDPFTGTMPVDPTAAPARDWNERISAECYRPERRARQPRRDVLGPRADAGRLAGRRRPARVPRVRRRRPRGERDGPAVPPRDPAARVGGRPADRDPLGPARFRAPLRAPARPGCGCPRRPSTWPRCGSWPTQGITPHDPRAVAGRVGGGPISTRAAPSGSTWATGGPSSRCCTTACCRRPCPSTRPRPSTRTRSCAIGSLPAAQQRAAPRRCALRHSWSSPRTASCTATTSRYRDTFLARLVGRAAPADLPFDTPVAGRGGRPGGGRGLPTSATAPRADVVELPPRHRALGGELRLRRRTGRWKAPAADARSSGSPAASTPRTDQLARDLPGRPGSVGGPRRLCRRRARANDRAAAFTEAWLAPTAATRRGTPDPGRAHGGPALAAGDVRELRLVLGVAPTGSRRPVPCGRPRGPPASSTAWPVRTSRRASSPTWRCSSRRRSPVAPSCCARPSRRSVTSRRATGGPRIRQPAACAPRAEEGNRRMGVVSADPLL